MKTRSVQIKLRESVPQEKALIDYLDSQGARTGTPKRLLINGFISEVQQEPSSNLPEKSVDTKSKNIEKHPFADLAVGG